MSKSNSSKAPTQNPPTTKKSKGVISDKATPFENIEVSSVKTKKGKDGSSKEQFAPSMPPPAASQTKKAVSSATVWNNNGIINALWSINQDKNSWIGDSQQGWKKLSNSSDSGIVSLTMLSSHAKQLGSTVHYRTEDDNMVHEMYVW